MAFHKIDKSMLPIIHVHMEGTPTDADFRAYLADMKTIYSQNNNIVVLYETAKNGSMNAEQRIELGKFLKENKEMINLSVLGVGYILHSTIARILLKGIFLVQKPVWKNKIFSDFDTAKAWADKLIADSKFDA